MSRVRMEFAKGPEVRFLSHLDLVKAFERAIRRAEIPIAFSEGFNPHPKMNFASALAVGVTSDKEYIDIELAQELNADEVVTRLRNVLPPGIDIQGGHIVPDHSASLMAEVNRAEYQVHAAAGEPIAAARLEAAIGEFLGLSEIVIIKRTKKGSQPRNIRPGIIDLTGQADGDRLQFRMQTITGSEGNIRPEEVVSALAGKSGLPIECDSLYIRRTALYAEKNGKLLNPMNV